MRVVFLDFDGVITTEGTYNAWLRAKWVARYPSLPYPQRSTQKRAFRRLVLDTIPGDAGLLDPGCCGRVQQLCATIDAKIVISSSWRNTHTLDVLRLILQTQGIVAEVFAATPTEGHRGREIASVVADLGLQPTDLVVLEDEEDVRPYNGRRIQTTFHGSDAGFQERHLRRALALFSATPS